jgi:hypothetical protein
MSVGQHGYAAVSICDFQNPRSPGPCRGLICFRPLTSALISQLKRRVNGVTTVLVDEGDFKSAYYGSQVTNVGISSGHAFAGAVYPLQPTSLLNNPYGKSAHVTCPLCFV